MTFWIDAQLSPALAGWLSAQFNISAIAVRDLGLRDADELEIFTRAKALTAIVMTKDRDFVGLLDRFGPPPQIVWLTCGNTSNASLRNTLAVAMPMAIELLKQGEPLVEIGDSWRSPAC